MLTGEAAAGTMTAVHGALVRDEEQNTVGITMGQTGAGGVGILVQGVRLFIGGKLQLGAGGDRLFPDGIQGIVQVDQGQVIRGDGHAQLAQSGGNDLFLFLGQVDVLLQLVQRLDTVFNLPMPVIPLLVGNVQEQAVFSALSHCDYAPLSR